MRGTRAFVLRFFLATVVACAIAAMGACSLGPKQDDPLSGADDTGGSGSDAAIGPDGPFGFDSPPSDTGKTGVDAASDTIGPFDDCDGGDAYPDGGCVPAPTDGGDADAPSDAPLDAPSDTPTDAPSDAVDDGDAGDVVVGG
jgi:hypothetical protein